MSRGQCHQGTHSGRSRTLERCRHNVVSKNALVIDIDNAESDVVIIDDPGTSYQGSRCSGSRRRGNSSPSNVISIDDDDDDDDDGGIECCPSTTNYGKFPTTLTAEEGRAHSQYNFPRNRYGLDYVSDSSDSPSNHAASSQHDYAEAQDSDEDSSDCEILDDASVRELWQKAALRKRMPQRVQAGKVDMATASTSSAESGTQPHEKTDDTSSIKCHQNETHSEEVTGEHSPNSSWDVEDGRSSCNPNAGVHPGGCLSGGKSSEMVAESDPAMDPNHETPGCQEETATTKGPAGPQSPNSDESNCGASDFCQSTHQQDVDVRHKSFTPLLEEQLKGESLAPEVGIDSSFDGTDRSFPASCSPDQKGEVPPACASSEKMEQTSKEAYCSTHQSQEDASDAFSVEEKESLFTEETCCFNSQPTDEPHFTCRSDCSRQVDKGCLGEQVRYSVENATTDKSCAVTVASKNIYLLQNDLDHDPEKPSRSTTTEGSLGFQNDLLGAREKHKESLEYKRAAEEEWAARQRQLKIQAGEAQRLRRRRKAECLRLLDMEKRQRQRLEEIRESQRKSEEAINLKEQLRVEVRKELEKMERRYSDMASLLQGFGIRVEGGEVKAAYKKALLRFHPDRVSRSDIHQQVRAEETFKFISRLKDKLLPGA